METITIKELMLGNLMAETKLEIIEWLFATNRIGEFQYDYYYDLITW